MTQEEKDLLLKDLCARLSHRIKINNEIQGDFEIYGICEDYIYGRSKTCHIDFSIEKIKPYLRPMSSMTEEELEELKTLCSIYMPTDSPAIGFEDYGVIVFTHHLTNNTYSFKLDISIIDWLNKKMFDYRGLIPMGLAIDCTNLNIY